VSVYRENTRDLILRDSDAFNISDGQTESWGIELAGEWGSQTQRLGVSASYGVHKYAFDRAADGREEIMEDNQIDTAPRWLGNVRWISDWTPALRSELEAVYVGAHYIHAANTARYEGHTVLNWRAQWQATEQLQLSLRVVNLLDKRYADRADFAFGSYRYFPGMPRQLYAGVRYTFN